MANLGDGSEPRKKLKNILWKSNNKHSTNVGRNAFGNVKVDPKGEVGQSPENLAIIQLRTWGESKIYNIDLDGQHNKICGSEFKENAETEVFNQNEKNYFRGRILNPMMFSFVNDFAEGLETSTPGNSNSANLYSKDSQEQGNMQISLQIKHSLENLLKLNEILKINLESETPTVVSSSETQLGLDQKSLNEMFETSIENSIKFEFLDKLMDQIISSIKSLVIGETLLAADNARQLLSHEIGILKNLFIEHKMEQISKCLDTWLTQISNDEEIQMLIFKIDQIRSALRHFNLSNRFQDFNFGYENSPINTFENEDKLQLNPTSNFLTKYKFFKINKWHRQQSSSFEKIGNPSSTGSASNQKLAHHHHHHILSHYRNHQNRGSSIQVEKDAGTNRKDERRNHLESSNDKERTSQLLIHTSNMPSNEGWNIENSKGVYLSYRIDTIPNGYISINIVIKSEIKCKLINLLTILNEVELSNMWVPYMSSSKCLYNLSRVSKLVQQIYDLPWPIGQRENIMFCFGVDTLREHDCIMISCGDPQTGSGKFFGIDIPEPPPKIPREKCSYLLFILTPSESARDLTTLEMFSSFNVSKYVPIKLASFLIKRMARKMYTDITTLASNPQGSPYENACNSNIQLYSWLDLKLSQYHAFKSRKVDQ
ncbi:putative START-2 domain protein [Cryptosporidium felis]|nr:putative START-2 domain protein [Cryptosporidium felis]